MSEEPQIIHEEDKRMEVWEKICKKTNHFKFMSGFEGIGLGRLNDKFVCHIYYTKESVKKEIPSKIAGYDVIFEKGRFCEL